MKDNLNIEIIWIWFDIFTYTILAYKYNFIFTKNRSIYKYNYVNKVNY